MTRTGGPRLNEVESDFVEFLSGLTGAEPGRVVARYIELKRSYRFDGAGFRELCARSQELHELLYDPDERCALMEAYVRQELMNTLRMVSYSFSDDELPPHRVEKRLKRLIGRGTDGDELSKTKAQRRAELAARMIEEAGDAPVVVDYGCGLAYLSLQIAGLRPQAEVYLVDIACMPIKFAKHRFDKRGYRAHVVEVSCDEPYPALPAHDICIAAEVMEHVAEPEAVYGNITSSMRPGGLLYGDFSDHKPDRLHVSTDLSGVRQRLKEEFTQAGPRLYRKLGPRP